MYIRYRGDLEKCTRAADPVNFGGNIDVFFRVAARCRGGD